jgi:hypothetical protein
MACHVKNFVIRRGLPVRMMAPNWPDRAMQFVDIPSGDLNMTRYAELMVNIGYPQRYTQVMGTKTAPLNSAWKPKAPIAILMPPARFVMASQFACGIIFVSRLAAGSFEDGMGAWSGGLPGEHSLRGISRFSIAEIQETPAPQKNAQVWRAGKKRFIHRAHRAGGAFGQ